MRHGPGPDMVIDVPLWKANKAEVLEVPQTPRDGAHEGKNVTAGGF